MIYLTKTLLRFSERFTVIYTKLLFKTVKNTKKKTSSTRKTFKGEKRVNTMFRLLAQTKSCFLRKHEKKALPICLSKTKKNAIVS